jgi:hypothetical protein
MSNFTAKHAKHLLVWMHVISSVGWCATAVSQLAMTGIALNADKAHQLVLFDTILALEDGILDPLGISAAYTGVMLSALTPWGYFRHWWVATKFWLTLACILLGSIFLGRWLESVVEALQAGHDDWSVFPLVAGTSFTVVALLLMIWVSIAKPWGRRGTESREERIAAKRVEQGQHPGLLIAAMLVPIAEYLSGIDYPLITFSTAVAYAVYRSRRLRRARRELATTAA